MQWLKRHGQDLQGRLWDVLYMLAHAGRRTDAPELLYLVSIMDWQTKRRREITLKSVAGAGDDGEPVITVMLPDQD